jgi:hypothetical protein
VLSYIKIKMKILEHSFDKARKRFTLPDATYLGSANYDLYLIRPFLLDNITRTSTPPIQITCHSFDNLTRKHLPLRSKLLVMVLSSNLDWRE